MACGPGGAQWPDPPDLWTLQDFGADEMGQEPGVSFPSKPQRASSFLALKADGEDSGEGQPGTEGAHSLMLWDPGSSVLTFCVPS